MQDNIIPFKKDKLFKNGRLVDLETGEVSNVDILVENKTIVAIEKWGKIESSPEFNFKNCEIIDLEGNFVMRAFVNAFCDSEKSVLNTYSREFRNFKEVFKQNDENSDGQLENAANFACAFLSVKSLLAGAIFAADMYYTRSAKMLDIVGNSLKWACVENVEELSESQLDEICMDVNKNDKRLFLKIGQTLNQLGTIDKHYGKQVSHVLEDFGLLDKKPIIVGGNCLEKDDLQVLNDYDCSFVITPYDDSRNARRQTNLVSLKSFGFNVGIGSGESCEIDFFAYMRQILLSTWSMFEDKSVLSEQEVLKMATKNGNEICMNAGPIKVGRRATFIVVRNEISLYDDIFKTLVWEKSKKDVLMTVHAGEILQKNGEILMKKAMDYDKIKWCVKNITKPTND